MTRLRRLAAAGGVAALLAASSGTASPVPARGLRVAGVAAEIRAAKDAGRVDPALLLEKMVMVFPVREPALLQRFLAELQNPVSPRFRKWLTPSEFGARFGATSGDLEAVAGWLRSEGLAVEGATAGRTALVFSGRAADVERAFDTELHHYLKNGKPAVANARPMTLPASLGQVAVQGLLPITGFERRRPLVRETEPLVTQGVTHYLAPADFATIYGLDALYPLARGAGRRIAIAARTNIDPLDNDLFRAYFGLPARDPIVVVNGEDPGIRTGDIALIETNLDVEWSGGVAPEADVVVVVSKSTQTTDGIDLSCLYAVDRDVADILSVSYGTCEQKLDPEEVAFFTNLWAQAAAEGISVVVSSGDAGAAGCESGTSPLGSIAGVNALGSSPYATSVGGTQLDSTANGSRYWSDANDPTTKKSVLGPVPEVAWNESALVRGGRALLASGGGASILYGRPAWQNVPGVPAGTQRLVPDISALAGGRSQYFMVSGGKLFPVYGTSASAPAFSGIAALLHEVSGGRLGSLNPSLYALGRRQYADGATSVFHDATSGNNSVPGVPGFAAGPGYDAVTGLGSPDMAALPAALQETSVSAADVDFDLTASPAVVALEPGGSASVRISLRTGSGADPLATIAVDAPPAGVSASLTPARAPADANPVGYASAGFPATLTLAATPQAPPGTMTLGVSAAAGAVTRRVSIFLTIGSPAPQPAGAMLQVPVVLNVPGIGGSHFTSDLVAVNRSGSDATLLFRYVPAPGTPGSGGPVFGTSLPAGREFYTSDATGYLAANGFDFSGGDPKGTLFLTFAGVSSAADVFAGSRSSTPNPDVTTGGSFGTFMPAVPEGSATSDETWVFGLREDTAFRSNLALVHAPESDSSAGPITLEVQLFDGETGGTAGPPLTQELGPGEFVQLGRVLTRAPGGLKNGYARVRRVSGTDRFIAYGVIDDGGGGGGGTSDGSLIVPGGTEGLIPVVVDLPGAIHYQTELTLTNPAPAPARATLVYTPAPIWGGGGAGPVTVDLAAGAQLLVPNALEFLRLHGLAIPEGRRGGTLFVSGAVAQARTFNPNPDASVGGTFGLAYPALDASSRATEEAFVYGLRQDATSRSNLAIADARVGGGPVDYVIDVFDAGTGAAEPTATFTRTLAGGEWAQIDGILEKAGITEGYARVRPAAGASDFVVYGVLNDGGSAEKGTSDGSYLPMAVVR
ncbi:MAG: protease pro-enzyme activation domain-containing protein [Acidithiobacillales bacterium]